MINFSLFRFFFVQTRTRKRKNTEQHEHCKENKVRRKEVHSQWLDSLSHCSEVKVLGEGSFGKVKEFSNIKDNYPSGIPISSPQNLKFAAFACRVLKEVSLLTVLILFLASIV